MAVLQPDWTRAGALAGFRDFVFLTGIDPDAFLRRAEIDPAPLNAPETPIRVDSYVARWLSRPGRPWHRPFALAAVISG